MEPGQSGAAVARLRDRLAALGHMQPSISARYDEALVQAVARAQAAHGLPRDGVAGEATLAEINVAAEDRLRSVLVALERERWNAAPRGARHVWVNLPAFEAQIVDDDRVTFRTRAVIGSTDADRETPEFSDLMEFMVINPSWYVPRSIILNEYLPQLRSNRSAASHLEIIDSAGRAVSRGSVSVNGSFPYGMRQPPGPGNALGVVKFMFPNPWNIYLHDTPSKDLFDRDVRAFSHGCIRLADPRDFALHLLARQTVDPRELFEGRLGSGAESRVDLDQPIPVHLDYRTAFTRRPRGPPVPAGRLWARRGHLGEARGRGRGGRAGRRLTGGPGWT
jgi:murein L,D-transpeptidase YcbB/YkuD